MNKSSKLMFGLNDQKGVSQRLLPRRGLLSGGVSVGGNHGHGARRAKAVQTVIRMPERQCQADKKKVQAIGRSLRAADPNMTIADQIRHPRMEPFARWREKTLRGWLSDVDTRSLASRRGRPKSK